MTFSLAHRLRLLRHMAAHRAGSEVYGDREVFDLMDEDDIVPCPKNAGGHVMLRGRCVYCGETG